MRPFLRFGTAPAAGLLVLSLVVATACGGGSSAGGASDYSRVATATAPARLPDPIFASGGRVAPANGLHYTVQSGDSPSSIAAKFGISVEDLMSANGITDPTKLVAGEVLVIPGASGTPVASPTATATTRANGQATATPAATSAVAGRTPGPGEQAYVVQSGDNASVIAARFGITVDELAAMNGTTANALRNLQVGDVLVVPAVEAEPTATEPPPTEVAPPLPTDTPPPQP